MTKMWDIIEKCVRGQIGGLSKNLPKRKRSVIENTSGPHEHGQVFSARFKILALKSFFNVSFYRSPPL
jgi:hypothetical protein